MSEVLVVLTCIILTSLVWFSICVSFTTAMVNKEKRKTNQWRVWANTYHDLFCLVCQAYDTQEKHLTALQNRDYASRN